MSEEEYKNCYSCRYYKNGYCENLELQPNYPTIGCDDFENKGDKEWVSVLDGSPLKDGRYYVTRHDFITQTDFTDILWYEKGIWWNRKAIGDYAVIAWRLLPQPYKPESEVQDENFN